MKILLAIDASKFSEAATQAVIELMRPEQTEVNVLHVVDLELPVPTRYAVGYRLESLREGEETVALAEQKLAKAGFKVVTAVEEGDPSSHVIDYAACWKADLIVVGSHGRRGLDRFLMGSVAESVARYTTCSMLIVRIPHSDEHGHSEGS